MEVKSVYKYARTSAQKVREVTREVQGMSVSHALSILNYTPKKAALLIGKTLNPRWRTLNTITSLMLRICSSNPRSQRMALL